MRKIYTRLILWLLKPAMPLPPHYIEFIEETNASPGDILLLRTTKTMHPDQRIYLGSFFDNIEKNTGVKIIILEPGVEFVKLIKFNDKGNYHS